MFIDRRNRHAFIATTEIDHDRLTEWAKHEPLVHIATDSDIPAGFSVCAVTRSSVERGRLWAYGLVHSEAGRRLANEMYWASYDRAAEVLNENPKLRHRLRDFQSEPKADLHVEVQHFNTYVRQFGYSVWPMFVDATNLPVVELSPSEVSVDVVKTPLIPIVPVFYINVESSRERRERLEQSLKDVRWSAKRVEAVTPQTFALHAEVDEDYGSLSRTRQIEQALSISHLRAIEEFVGTQTEWGLILEDDVDLACVSRWDFKLTDLPDVVPSNCGILQLSQIWPVVKAEGKRVELGAPNDLKIKPYSPNFNWGTGAYLIRREYAQSVLSYFRSESGNFDLSRHPGRPTADVLFYDHTQFHSTLKAYSVVLLACRDVASTLEHPSHHEAMHKFSRLFALQLMRADKPDQPKIKLSEVFGPVQAIDYPFVSILTPTYNRRHLLPLLEKCILDQNYPRCRMEWVIVDDSQDGQPDYVPQESGLVVRNIRLKDKLALGAKRNFTGKQARGQICVFMDDDDYYMPQRVRHAIETLQAHPEVHVVGSTYLPIYFINLDEFYLAGPWGQNHAMGGAMAHRRIYIEAQQFDETAAKAEERSFLNGYTTPLVQLDPWQAIICLSHESNTFDKKNLLGSRYMNPSPRSIDSLVPANLLEEYKSKHRT